MDTHYDIVRRSSVASTQDVALSRFRDSGIATLVVAGRQLAGRGRADREWVEPTAGMFSSFAFRPSWEQGDFGIIPLCAGVALLRAIGGGSVDLKWPNDILMDGRKVGGILVEGSDGVVVVGCGLNLWWDEPPGFAGSLLDSEPADGYAGELANAWVDQLLAIVSGPSSGWPIDDYRASCVTIGSRVRWDGGIGRALDVGQGGGLVVEGLDGISEVLSGDVHLLPGG